MAELDRATFREACRARRTAAALYLHNPRVTLIDVGWRIQESRGGEPTGELAVRVHVHAKPRGAALEAFAARHPQLVVEKERIPFPTVDIIEGSYPLHWFGSIPQPPVRGRVFPQLRGGISVSTEYLYGYGTLGGIVLDRRTGAPMILSNWHVLAGSAYASRGLRILQPGMGDGGTWQHAVARLERHAMDDGIDAAVAALTGARPWRNEQLEIGAVAGTGRPALGDRVRKSGRGSGLTAGVIDGVDGEYSIRYGGFPHRVRDVCRIVPGRGATEASRGGDSGSWWLDAEGRRATALHFAGSDDPETALAIAMPEVLDALEVDVALGAG
jgi:endonuclease G